MLEHETDAQCLSRLKRVRLLASSLDLGLFLHGAG